MADLRVEPLPVDEEEIARQGAKGALVLARTAGGLSHHNAVMLDDVEVKKVVRITAVKVTAVSFKSDHAVMRDHTADWDYLGAAYPKPDWAAAQKTTNPVSHTKSAAISLSVVLNVEPADATDAPCSVTGTATFGALSFVGLPPLKGGTNTVTVTSPGVTLKPDTVARLTGDITWTVEDLSVEPKRVFGAGTSAGFEVFFTMGKSGPPGPEEEGTTYKRMAKAVQLVANTGESDPHKIAEKLMGLFGEYVLTWDSAVPVKLKHPDYFNSVGGAWWMNDYMTESGECQAMVRFVLAVMQQVGCPGTFERRVVFAELDASGAVVVKDEPSSHSGLTQTKKVGEEEWIATLVDKPPVVGKTYTEQTMGLNALEACLRLTHGNATSYYPGGVQAIYKTKEQVIQVFNAFCWIKELFDSNGKATGEFVIREIVKKWK
jgi:hypothetical protein